MRAKKYLTVMYILGVFLTGCSSVEEAEVQINMSEAIQTNEKEQYVVVGNDKMYNIYNCIRGDDRFLFFSDVDGIYKADADTFEYKKIAEGKTRIGNMDGRYIYFLRMPDADHTEDAGVRRLDIEKNTEEQIIEWNDTMWECVSIFIQDNIVYLECNKECLAYTFDASKQYNEKLKREDNRIYQIMNKCGIAYDEINMLAYGYINFLYQYEKVVCIDRNESKVKIYDLEGNLLKIIDGKSDLLVMPIGIVYQDGENNIWLNEWEDINAKCIYNCKKNGNRRINYGTYNSNYIYGFYEGEGYSELVQIGWDGSVQIRKKFENVTKSVELRFSATEDIISYWLDGSIIFERIIDV